MPIMEISVVPVGTEEASVSKYIAEVVKVLKREKNINYKLSAMGTIIEADSIEKLFEIGRKMHQVPFKKGVERVVTSIKIDDRKNKKISINGKVNSVNKKLKR